LFFDSVHPQHQSQAVHGWIKKGSKLAIPSTPKQLRVHYIGSININNAAQETVTQSYDTIKGEAVINFFDKLHQFYTHKTKLHIILDNASYHKSKEVKAYLANHSKIQLHYLPSYSPNLNPIERLWKVMRQHTTYNRYYPTFKEFKTKIDDFFTEKIPTIGDVLSKRINDNFQIIQPVFLQV
jgi:transposase